MRSDLLAALLAGVASVSSGCYPSNVLAVRDRAVAIGAEDAAQWRPCAIADLSGYFESYAVDGDAALSLRKVYYLFVPGGRYTGAALVESDEGASFQTLGGAWSLDAAGLSLDGAPPVRCDVADGGLLRISLEGGAISLRKVEVR